MSKLPDILSELIMVAVGDVKRLPDDIHMDMSVWFKRREGGFICSVCLGGAVMWSSLGDIRLELLPEKEKIYALDAVRDFALYDALSYMDQSCDDSIISGFHEWINKERLVKLRGEISKEETIDTMTKVANWLKERGL